MSGQFSNGKTRTLKLTRHEVIDLLIMLVANCESNHEIRKWFALHDKIRNQLDAQDSKELEKAKNV